jgi:hypothetical protein
MFTAKFSEGRYDYIPADQLLVYLFMMISLLFHIMPQTQLAASYVIPLIW